MSRFRNKYCKYVSQGGGKNIAEAVWCRRILQAGSIISSGGISLLLCGMSRQAVRTDCEYRRRLRRLEEWSNRLSQLAELSEAEHEGLV